MAEQTAVPGPSTGALRVVLIVAGLVFLAAAALSLCDGKQIHDLLNRFDTAAESSTGNEPTGDTPPPTTISPRGIFLLRLASVVMTAPALLCFIAAARPLKYKGGLWVLILLGLLVGAGAIVFGIGMEIDLLFYAVFALAGLLLAVLLLALYPYGGVRQEDEPQ